MSQLLLVGLCALVVGCSEDSSRPRMVADAAMAGKVITVIYSSATSEIRAELKQGLNVVRISGPFTGPPKIDNWTVVLEPIGKTQDVETVIQSDAREVIQKRLS